MTKEEALEIKSEIIKKSGDVIICNCISIPEAILISDVLNIINSHIDVETEQGLAYADQDTMMPAT